MSFSALHQFRPLLLAASVSALLAACAGTWSSSAPAAVSSAERPQLTAAQAGSHAIATYLAKGGPISALVTDGWNPTAGVNISGVKPDYVVDAAGSLKSVQAAINAAVIAVDSGKKPATTRQYIQIKPGTYKEALFVPAGVTLTLYSDNADASKTVITTSASANTPAAEYQKTHNPGSDAPPSVVKMFESCAKRPTTLGTGCSSGSTIKAVGFEAKNLTWRNDFDESTATKGLQAVALLVDGGDKANFDNVRFIGHQDTLYLKSASAEVITRTYFKGCHVEGDVDFIFGRAVAVFDNCTIHFVSTRQGREGGYLLAPSTVPQHPYGYLIINSRLTADAGTPANSIYIGRSWDEGRNSKDKPYEHGTSANGQAVVRNSVLGVHIRKTDPWGPAASTNRPYSAAQNRFYEFGNSGPGAQ